MPSSSMPPPLPRAKPAAGSSFVTILAWVSMGLGVLGVVGGLLQAVIMASLNLGDELLAGLAQGNLHTLMPPQVLWLLEHLQLLNGVSVLFSLVTCVVSWALLRRYEWGRLGFIALLVLGVVFGMAMTAFMAGVLEWMLAQAAGDAAMADPMLDQSLLMSKASMYAGTLVVALLHGLIGWKLCTPEIRAEFRSA
ncbi:MAG TPA: hypothetical protein VM469_10845 [Pseudoxanthomonas sp.]|nr:hypothetical protein [Pseudoxanthomonas sp.]